MKQKFGLIAILFLAITLVLVGCNPKEKPEEKPTAEFNALGDWTGDAAYTITENKKEELSFSYAKGTTPNAVLKSATITEDLSKMQTLVITLEGLGTVMVEIVNKDGNSIKVYLTIPVVKDTYQWNLKQDADFMKGVNQVRITAAPGKENSVGNAKVTSLLFKEAVASGFIIAKDYTDIDETVHEYAGEAGDWHFNSKWHVGNTNDEAIYDIKTEGTKVTVNVSKDSAGSYALMRVLIKGDFSNFNFVVVKAKGKAGEKVLLKIRDNPQAEQTFRFTGEDQFLFYDISNWTAAEKKALDRVMIFALPGLTTGTTSFEIQDVYLTDKYDTGIIKNVYNGLVNEFVIKNYYDIAGEGYKVQNNANGESVVEYKKTDNTYPPLISYITGDISRFNFAEIVVTGTAGKKMMVKIEGTGANFEQEIEFNGNKQTIGLDIISKLKADQRKGINRVIIYAEPGTKDVEGKFTIHSFTFKDKVLNITDRLKDAAKDNTKYTITENPDGSLEVTFNTTKGAYDSIANTPLFSENYQKLAVILKGEAGKEVLVKINNKLEKKVVFTASGVGVVTFTLNELKTKDAAIEEFTEVRFFGAPGVANVEGTFTIVSIELIGVYELPAVAADIVVDVNKDWKDNDKKGYYTFTTDASGKVTVDYDKPVGTAWALLRTDFAELLSNHNTLTITVKGTAGKKIIIKPNDGTGVISVNTPTKGEETVIFDGSEQTIVFKFTSRPQKIYIFVEYEATEAVTGSFEIISAKVSYVKPN